MAAWGVGAVIFGVGGWAWGRRAADVFRHVHGPEPVAAAGERERWAMRKAGGATRGRCWRTAAPPRCAPCCRCCFPHWTSGRAHLLFLAALAAANADTWATEIGSALGGRPYDLRTGKPAPPGTSGAVSLPGTLAALAGAALIGLFAGDGAGWGVVTAAGFGGAFLDSLLGATVQARWPDPLRPGRLHGAPPGGAAGPRPENG